MDKHTDTKKGDCECYACKHGKKAFVKHEKKSIKKCGFATRFVFDDTQCPNNSNIITVGLDKTMGHLNFQLCLPVSPEIAHQIFWNLVNNIKKGKKYEIGPLYDDILGNGYKLKFIAAQENDRDVLRLILPNPEGTYTGKIYEAQFTKLNSDANVELN